MNFFKITKMSMRSTIALFAAVCLTFTACEKEPEVLFTDSLNDDLKAMKSIEDKMPSISEPVVESTQKDTTEEYYCHIDYYQAAAGYDEQMVLNPQTDVIYPGALIKGESILDGTYTLISAKRKPITISTSLLGGANTSIEVPDPKLSTIREAVNSLMKQEYDVPYANLSFTIEQANSEQQLDLALRASYKGGGVNVKGGFDFSNKKVKSWPASLGESAAHTHFNRSASNYQSFDKKANHIFAVTTETEREWPNLKGDDKLVVKIDMKENDTSGDDKFTISTFEIPVPEIITSMDQGFYEKTGLKVYSGTQSIDFTFKLTPTLRRLK